MVIQDQHFSFNSTALINTLKILSEFVAVRLPLLEES